MKTKIAIIVAAFIFLCVVSVNLSSVYFSSGMSTQTAHVLTSLRALHEWGFFNLSGISILVPRSAELAGVDLHRFTLDFNEGIYLSYPSGWLDLPYAAFVISHAIVPTIEIGPAFLMIYNIVVDRLLTAALFTGFLALFLSQLVGKRLSPHHFGFLALIGSAFWLTSPPVLYWTQNAYGMDQAVIPFVIALLLFVTWKKCRLTACIPVEKILLFLIVFFLCFIDWYGWVAGGITIAACLVLELCIQRPHWRHILTTYAIPLIAVICVAGIFLFQLLSFPDGFHQLVLKYGIRSAHSTETLGMTAKLWELWHAYLPFGHAVILIGLSVLSYLSFVRRNAEKASVIVLTVALFLPPFVWTILLPQHSAVHEFSLLKFALPTATLYVVVAAFISTLLRRYLRANEMLIDAAILLSVLWFTWTMIGSHTYEPLVYQDDKETAEIALLMKAAVASDDIPLGVAELLVGSRPPHKIWYADRWIYPISLLKKQIAKGFASEDALKTMHPVYLQPEGSYISSTIEHLCLGLWEDTGVTINGIPILSCRTEELRKFYLP